MAKVLGKDLELWFNGVEIPVVSIGLSEAFDSLDSTDSATPSTGKDFVVNRAARSFTAEAVLREANGAAITTGDTVIGTTYVVLAVDSTLTDYEVGQIFTAEAELALSADDSVAVLGDVVTGKSMVFNNGSPVCVSAIDYSVKYDQLDVTDNCTTGDGSETVVSRAERDTKISCIVQDDEADLLEADPVAVATTLTFNTGQTVVGSAIPLSKNVSDEAVGYAKVDYAFKWVGEPTETAIGLTAGGSEAAFELILRRGTTNKSYAGNAILTEKTISTDIKGLAKVSYNFFINGAVTYAEYSA